MAAQNAVSLEDYRARLSSAEPIDVTDLERSSKVFQGALDCAATFTPAIAFIAGLSALTLLLSD